MKRFSIVVLLFLMALFVFGCSGTDSDKQNLNDASNVDQSENGDKTDEPVQINFYSFKKDDPSEPWVKAVEAFNEAHDEIQVEYVNLVQSNDDADFLTKLDIMMSSGETIDVFQTGNEDAILARADRGVIEPLNKYYEEKNLDPDEEYVINPNIDGDIYGVIAQANQWLVAFNKDHLDEAGLELPEMGWTWEDFREYAEVLTTEDHYGTYFYTWGEYPNLIAYNEFAHPQLKQENDEIKVNFDHPSFEYFFELRRNMEKEDQSVIPYSELLATDVHILTPFYNEEASMIPVGSFVLTGATVTDKFPHDFQTVFAPMPRSSEDAEVGYTEMDGSFYAIGANSKNKEASFEFVRWMSTEGADYIQTFPGWKKADGDALVEELYGDNKDLVDLESLANTMYHPEVKVRSSEGINVSYGAELKKVVEDGFAKFMLDNSTFEEAKQQMVKEGTKIIEGNK